MVINQKIRFFVISLLAVSSGLSAFAEEPSATDDAVTRLKFMKESTEVYRTTAGKDDKTELKPQADPALRWNNPVSGLVDGTLFFWTSVDGRPYAAAQVFLVETGVWLHEFQSLTTESCRFVRDGKPAWIPEKPGITWKDVPKAPVPAKSAPLRLSQMRSIIERFGANDDFEGDSRWELRSLPKPLLRYSSEAKNIDDGATFAFVHTTDPEVFVTLEAYHEAGKEPVWRYSLAPMTAYALKVTLDGDLVWEKPWSKEPIPITSPYKVVIYKP